MNIHGVVHSDGTITQHNLDALVNKEVFVLSYISGTKEDGRNRYQMWDILSDSRLYIGEDFQTSVGKGYPKNYQPELLLEESNLGSSTTNDSF